MLRRGGRPCSCSSSGQHQHAVQQVHRQVAGARQPRLGAAAATAPGPPQQQLLLQRQQQQQQQQTLVVSAAALARAGKPQRRRQHDVPQQQQQAQLQQQQQQHDQPQQQQQQQPVHQEELLAQLPHGLHPSQLPKHVALIMDGNSRWARRRGLPTLVGHERGVAALRRAVVAARRWGIQALTVFAFSAENWGRPPAEVEFLLGGGAGGTPGLFERALREQLPELQAHGVRLAFMGDLSRLPPALQQQAAAAAAATDANTGLLLSVALNYGAQQDVAAAAQALARRVQAGQLAPEQITPQLVQQHLSSAAAVSRAGPPDLLIRTSGERRLSNYLLLECAYTELIFCDECWPDFDDDAFGAALLLYAQRQRRYGRRSRAAE